MLQSYIYVRAYMARAHILARICTRAIASHSHLIISTLDYCSAIVVQYSFFFNGPQIEHLRSISLTRPFTPVFFSSPSSLVLHLGVVCMYDTRLSYTYLIHGRKGDRYVAFVCAAFLPRHITRQSDRRLLFIDDTTHIEV